MYRYSKSAYNLSLNIMGGIRVGTLHDFRRSDHKRGISDPGEGKKTISHFFENESSKNADQSKPSALEALGMITPGSTRHVEIQNLNVQRAFSSPNYFILCTSANYSQKTLSQFEDADSCLEIVRPDEFYEILTDALNSLRRVVFRGVFKVTYQNRLEIWNGRTHGTRPALIKPIEDFPEQDEMRAIWECRDGGVISPINVIDHRLGACCRMRDLKPL